LLSCFVSEESTEDYKSSLASARNSARHPRCGCFLSGGV